MSAISAKVTAIEKRGVQYQAVVEIVPKFVRSALVGIGSVHVWTYDNLDEPNVHLQLAKHI